MYTFKENNCNVQTVQKKTAAQMMRHNDRMSAGDTAADNNLSQAVDTPPRCRQVSKAKRGDL